MITNYFSPLEFLVSIKRLPNVEFFTQRASIPSISATPVEIPNVFNRMYQTPDKLNYDNFNFSFIIDENMSNYLEVFNWMKGITFPENFNQFKTTNDSRDGIISDVTLVVLNSNKNGSIKIDFKNCFPIALSEVTLDTTQTDIIYPEATVTFQYDYFDIELIKD